MATLDNIATLATLEGSEIAAWGDLYRAASTDSIRACGLRITECDGAITTVASSIDVLGFNRVIGLGLEREATDRDLDEITDQYIAAGVPRFFVQVCPSRGSQNLIEQLRRRGFRHHNNWVKLCRDTSPPPPIETDLTIRAIGPQEAAAFARIVCACFDWPDAAQPWVRELVGFPGWRHYMAFDGEEPVATGACLLGDGWVWKDFAATLPAYRNRGAQAALLARSIDDVRGLGYQQIVVETAEDTPTKPSPSYRNMLRFGFRPTYVRPNWLFPKRDSCAMLGSSSG
jgi:GNAT superfamily N-acetyltransferase